MKVIRLLLTVLVLIGVSPVAVYAQSKDPGVEPSPNLPNMTKTDSSSAVPAPPPPSVPSSVLPQMPTSSPSGSAGSAPPNLSQQLAEPPPSMDDKEIAKSMENAGKAQEKAIEKQKRDAVKTKKEAEAEALKVQKQAAIAEQMKKAADERTIREADHKEDVEKLNVCRQQIIADRNIIIEERKKFKDEQEKAAREAASTANTPPPVGGIGRVSKPAAVQNIIQPKPTSR